MKSQQLGKTPAPLLLRLRSSTGKAGAGVSVAGLRAAVGAVAGTDSAREPSACAEIGSLPWNRVETEELRPLPVLSAGYLGEQPEAPGLSLLLTLPAVQWGVLDPVNPQAAPRGATPTSPEPGELY